MRASRCAVLLVWSVFLPSAVFAQASITGTVKDTSGAVLPGVTVEAASPVLIERIRTAVTDSSGRYQVVDLRPGTYVITFTLAGFNTVKREGVVLSGSAPANVDGELRVGSLQETITVTGEAPVVDIRSTTQQRVLSSEAIDALPSARNYFGLARMIPNTQGGGNDVGGSLIQDVGQSVTVHGSRNVDQRVTVNGVNTMTLQAGGNIGGQTPDVGSAAEVSVDTNSLSADLPTGGVRINFVPKDGGNKFANSTFFTFSNKGLQGSNFSDQLQLAGLTTPNRIVKNVDLNESFGGPISRDKVWFWFSSRYNETANQVAVFRNKNEYDPTKWLYEPDTSQPGENKGYQVNSSLRVTWQASPRNKIAGTYKADKWCNCPNNISATVAPEAGRDRRFPRLRQEHAEWTSPVTNKLLFEAVGLHLFERWGNMHYRVNGGSLEDPATEAILPQLIGVLEQSNNLNYRILTNYNNTAVPSWTYRAASTYVTGSHAMKVGFNRTHGYLDEYQYALNPVSYRFNQGVPNRITERAMPFRSITNLDNDLGFYGQDRWTVDKVTVQGAIRFDYFATSFPEQTVGPAPLTPTRNITFPAQDNISWKDLTYRSALAYDLFGNGKTALKVAFNKYLLGQTLNGLGRNPNPVLSLRTTANRPWNDRGGLGINGDYIPQCDLLNPLQNGECGPIDDTAFGTSVPGDLYDKDLISGFNHRQANWEFSTSVQREILPRVSVDVGYFRRAWAHFQVTDNILVAPQDFTAFNVVAPQDPRLPGGGGYTLTGFYDVVPEKAGQVRNLNTLSDKYGHQFENWNGIDLTLDARLNNGLTFQGGLSTGKTMEDNCEIVAKLPEMNNLAANGTLPASWRPAQFCHRESPFVTQLKAYGVYVIPKVDMQISGSFRSIPGQVQAQTPPQTDINLAYIATNAFLATNSTLGRALSGQAPSVSLQLLEPYSTYLERRQELDLRFGKVLRMRNGARAVISLDLFNALNSDATVNVNQNLGTVNRANTAAFVPTEILNPRVAKISLNFDF
ncbi:MAG TPA: carboxypeptidase regulatory-like domain-containing protein [Vicinamibacterales bacterium]